MTKELKMVAKVLVHEWNSTINSKFDNSFIIPDLFPIRCQQ